jgi:hypothetical protein
VKMKNFNPFNPQKDSFGYERNKERNDKLVSFLQARSSGKKATLDIPVGFGGRRGGGPGGGPGGFGGPRPGGAPGAPGAPRPPR